MKIYRREKTVEIYVKTQNVENLATPENRHSGAASVRESAIPFFSFYLFLDLELRFTNLNFLAPEIYCSSFASFEHLNFENGFHGKEEKSETI